MQAVRKKKDSIATQAAFHGGTLNQRLLHSASVVALKAVQPGYALNRGSAITTKSVTTTGEQHARA